ncbi:MAG: hypothetical protein ATN36_03560 [Epulopiscium sp. Nele67-Bin005]|nr:MAG: hypothetical protein ATN36_03560 [Epulopiscium sp. Nele67-Bin005]
MKKNLVMLSLLIPCAGLMTGFITRTEYETQYILSKSDHTLRLVDVPVGGTTTRTLGTILKEYDNGQYVSYDGTTINGSSQVWRSKFKASYEGKIMYFEKDWSDEYFVDLAAINYVITETLEFNSDGLSPDIFTHNNISSLNNNCSAGLYLINLLADFETNPPEEVIHHRNQLRNKYIGYFDDYTLYATPNAYTIGKGDAARSLLCDSYSDGGSTFTETKWFVAPEDRVVNDDVVNLEDYHEEEVFSNENLLLPELSNPQPENAPPAMPNEPTIVEIIID